MPKKKTFYREEEIYKQFYNIASVPQRTFIIFYAKDGGTMLRENHIEEMYQINRIITNVLNNTKYFDVPICHPFCDVNKPISVFWVMLKENPFVFSNKLRK